MILRGVVIAVFGLALLGSPGKVMAVPPGIINSVVPFLDPINAIVNNVIACNVNFLWGCDGSGNALPAPVPPCSPNNCASITGVGNTCDNGCGTMISGNMSVDIKANGSNGPISLKNVTPFGVNWTVTGNPSSCNASIGWFGSKSVAGGSESIAPIAASTNLKITCQGSGGSVTTDSVAIDILPLPIVDWTTPDVVKVDLRSMGLPQVATLAWSTVNATTCVVDSTNHVWNEAIGISGSHVVSVPVGGMNEQFIITCQGPGGSGSATAMVASVCYPQICAAQDCVDDISRVKFGVPDASLCMAASVCRNDSDCRPKTVSDWKEVAP